MCVLLSCIYILCYGIINAARARDRKREQEKECAESYQVICQPQIDRGVLFVMMYFCFAIGAEEEGGGAGSAAWSIIAAR